MERERAVAWAANEITEITGARIAGKSAEDIKALVQRLHTQRQSAA